MEERFLNAQEAAAELGVSLATLYAYASRGMLRSESMPGESRARRYPRQDVLRLKEKKELRRDPERVAPKALSWGAPVLSSAITPGPRRPPLLSAARDATELARTSVEAVASLIWTGEPDGAAALFAGELPPLPGWSLPAGLTPIERCQVAVPWLGRWTSRPGISVRRRWRPPGRASCGGWRGWRPGSLLPRTASRPPSRPAGRRGAPRWLRRSPRR